MLQRGADILPCSLIQQDESHWRALWGAGIPPEVLAFTLRKVGVWGDPGTSAALSIPVPNISGPRPASFDMQVEWPESLDIRPSNLSGFVMVPVAETTATVGETQAAKLALRAANSSPEGKLLVTGRKSDVRATVVTAVSVGEDRATVRTLLTWDVRFAPANTFRVVLPKGTGSAVKFDDRSLRESAMRRVADGEEWTLVTQDQMLGSWSVAAEWPLAARPGVEPIEAPEVRVLGVSSQRGYLVLESAEALRLRYETGNLTEIDAAEVPPVPWRRDNRVLAAFPLCRTPIPAERSGRAHQDRTAH